MRGALGPVGYPIEERPPEALLLWLAEMVECGSHGSRPELRRAAELTRNVGEVIPPRTKRPSPSA